MKRIGVLVEGVLPSFRKYEILNENKLNEALKSNDFEDVDKLKSNDIIKYVGTGSFGFVYEDEICSFGLVTPDGEYNFFDEQEPINSINDEFIECDLEDKSEEQEQLKSVLNNILSSDNKKLLYYYDNLKFDFIDEDEDSDITISSTPENNYIPLFFEIEDDEEFDLNKLVLITKYIGSYENSFNENNFRGMIAPICEKYGILSDYEPDTCMLVTNKVIYDGKIIDSYSIPEPMFSMNDLRPFIVDGDINNITLL